MLEYHVNRRFLSLLRADSTTRAEWRRSATVQAETAPAKSQHKLACGSHARCRASRCQIPLDCIRQAVHHPEAPLDALNHQVADIGAVDPPLVATQEIASRSQQSSVKAMRTFPPLSQPISNPSEHHRVSGRSTATRPSWQRSSLLPVWRSSSTPCAFMTR